MPACRTGRSTAERRFKKRTWSDEERFIGGAVPPQNGAAVNGCERKDAYAAGTESRRSMLGAQVPAQLPQRQCDIPHRLQMHGKQANHRPSSEQKIRGGTIRCRLYFVFICPQSAHHSFPMPRYSPIRKNTIPAIPKAAMNTVRTVSGRVRLRSIVNCVGS